MRQNTMTKAAIVIAITIAIVVAVCVVDAHRRQQYIPIVHNDIEQQICASPHVQDLISGNSLSCYTGLDSMLPDLMDDIQHATRYVLVQFFKFEYDTIGYQVQQTLIQTACRGIKVYVLYDAAACWSVPRRFFQQMRTAGVHVEGYNPLFPLISGYSNYRNHRKVVVVDGDIGYVGGMNIAERYVIGVHGGSWHDLFVRMTGPLVEHLQVGFQMDYQLETSEAMSLPLSDTPSSEAAGDISASYVISHPEDSVSPIIIGLVEMISHAKQYVYLQSPYYIPPHYLTETLCNAAQRGIDVRLMIPSRGDRSILTSFASRAQLKPLLDAGVSVMLHHDGFLHTKMVVSDDQWVTLGSMNLDYRSIRLSNENNLFIRDKSFACQMRTLFESNSYCSDTLPRDWWNQRSAKERFMEAVSKPLTYQL